MSRSRILAVKKMNLTVNCEMKANGFCLDLDE